MFVSYISISYDLNHDTDLIWLNVYYLIECISFSQQILILLQYIYIYLVGVIHYFEIVYCQV